MNPKIADSEQRQLALDHNQSFIVQAPAGSGKTSLLVQRYLMLLARVNSPEEIVAITFTRKAAFAMRDRIVQALKQAAINTPIKDNYEATTQKLAVAALKQDQLKGWQITHNPNRLRIQTIDALCYHLVKQMPILDQASINPKILQNQEAETHYREVARTVLANITEPEYASYLETLLLHLDNDWQRAENLCSNMLKSREQWLPHIVGLSNNQELRQTMEAALKNIAQENLEHCITLFPKDSQEELYTLLKFAKDNHDNPPTFLQEVATTTSLHHLEFYHWQGMAGFLLTKEFTWRKKITKEHGFPTASTATTKAEKELFKLMKERMESLLLKFSNHENFRISLENLLACPPPIYNDQQWEMIEALLRLLPLLAAQLKVTFTEHNVTDHAEIAMAAARALGENDLPSELALNLDYRLQHLLIDEFQDTSVMQHRLIAKLITNWQPGDGRTLFVVGDPMQSIYRFREAEVGIFLRTQTQSLGELQLQPLTLTTNFRSSQQIVGWLNINFAKILPPIADIAFGAVPFRPATATKIEPGSQIKIALLKNADASTETAHVVTTIKQIQQHDPLATIAILVRARNHLQDIITAMRKSNLDYQAHELTTLEESIVIRDLFALTRALVHPADRIAWLAILRAPWCGLSLKDLHIIANGKSELLWDNLCNFTELPLSADGNRIITRIQTTLAPIFNQRGRIGWRDLIATAWINLGGPATVTEEIELEYAKTYFQLLNTNHLDISIIQKKLTDLYAPTTPNAKIQIMTIHKAKGLEFDHVIIPGVDRSIKSDERKLLLWFERPKMDGDSDLLLAPIEASGKKTDQVYQYLQLVEQKKTFYETGRLLYVALTRTKKTAHIIGCLKCDQEQSYTIPKNSLLSQLAPCFEESWLIDKLANITPTPDNTAIKASSHIQRLNKDWFMPIEFKTLSNATVTPNWQLSDNQAAILGTVIHQCLKQISEEDLNSWQTQHLATQNPYWHKLLQQLGYLDIEHGLQLIQQAIKLTLADQRGRWILAKHKNAANELAITTKINGSYKQFIIDRTFVDEDEARWIIDYKTSVPDQANHQEFLDNEQAKYSEQLWNYARVMQQLEPSQPTKLGLYFPLFGGWVELNQI